MRKVNVGIRVLAPLILFPKRDTDESKESERCHQKIGQRAGKNFVSRSSGDCSSVMFSTILYIQNDDLDEFRPLSSLE